MNHHQYRKTIKYEKSYFIVYSIPQKWSNDVTLFMEGKFSKMSQAAKDAIMRFSGLGYKERKGDEVLTDGRLLALDKHPVLKKMWENELSSHTPYINGKGTHRSVVELDEETELLSIPGKESYIELEGLV